MSIQHNRSRIVALALVVACGQTDKPRVAGPSLAIASTPSVVAPSPATAAELLLASGDSAIDLAASPDAPEAAILVRGADGKSRVERWTVGDAKPAVVVDLPDGFQARGIAAHPTKQTYFVSGGIAGKSQILTVEGPKTNVVFETPREIGRLIVGPRPFSGDSGTLYRLFFETKLPSGGSSLRSVTERGTVEYQVVGPTSERIAFPEDHIPGGIDAPSGTPIGFHPRGQPLYWRDQRGCTHALAYASGWTEDKPTSEIPCDGASSLTPNGNAYVHWRKNHPGISLIGKGIASPGQAGSFTFLAAPVSVPDGRGIIGIVDKGGSRFAIEYVPLDVPLADVANAWQHPVTTCEIELFAREGGSFRESSGQQLFQVYEHFNYEAGASVPFLATTDLFWDNFGAAFNGVFIVSEKERAIGAFWAFVDSANSALARTAPGTKWAKAFSAIADSRKPNATGEAGLIARETGKKMSTVVDTQFDFAELMPRGHYTSTPEMKQYFRAVHYLTEIGKSIDEKVAAPLVALPASVHQAAWRWIDVYRPFVASPRSALVWTGGTMPPIAPYSKHPAGGRRMFPLSWGLDNEVLESTVLHTTWPPDEQVDRLHPSGLDVALVYGNGFARSLLANELRAMANFDRVTAGITARRPRIAAGSSVYDRWLDALGAEWADSIRFPSAPANSKLWDVKRLQTGLASWATLREATILVNERPEAAEGGEGGFEELVLEQPRGYVEPAPNTFEAIAQLFESLSRTVAGTNEMEASLRAGITLHLDSSAARVRRFGAMAEREVRGQPLSESDYEAIRSVAGIAEHDFVVYKSLANKDEGIPKPDSMAKIADVAGDLRDGVLEVAVGNPLEWRQIVPYFGRREIVTGGVYSYHEFVSKKLYDNEAWRKEVAEHPHPAWVQPMIAKPSGACSDTGAR